MSPLWRDQLRIVLGPQQVAVIRIARGQYGRITGKRVVSCNESSDTSPPWRTALTALESVLPEVGARRADVTVVLSNHFVRYALIEGCGAINTAEEEQALVHHHFERIYGAAADQWASCLSRGDDNDDLRLACALDQDLLEALRALFQPTPLRLRSVQPYLMAAFNQLRRYLKDAGWFALVEPGGLCLARFRNHNWQSVKSIRVGKDWVRELAVEIEREQLLSACESAGESPEPLVFVFAPGCYEALSEPEERHSVRLLRRHSVRLLNPLTRRDGADLSDAPYAIALIG